MHYKIKFIKLYSKNPGLFFVWAKGMYPLQKAEIGKQIGDNVRAEIDAKWQKPS